MAYQLKKTRHCVWQKMINVSLLLMLTIMCSPSFSEPLQQIPFQSEWLKNHYNDRMTMFNLQPLEAGDIVFIGDSITEQGMSWGRRFGDLAVRNRGIKGDMTYGVLARLEEMKANPPKSVFIMIGINDIFNLYYQQKIKSLSSVSLNIEKITE
ncbi:GDSL-type esterase/lipase family protein [Shewanella saliphila]|uniref:SGNH hydrolase-type esterase domain-containing protein n=1 Tax=Shewanella saliphila TaxID=2282698 RepID=A0ABQ2Q8R3_9GAMM|nr:GDSL-type esterase/lipase family protein [Shewanella saliphila]MCL1102545.1 GDSL-type esterase/lipase family protein [Shewanella saliphila]GGP56829.1 hypothetical protein GCM10009409_23710 [Shewanella saliphila]